MSWFKGWRTQYLLNRGYAALRKGNTIKARETFLKADGFWNDEEWQKASALSALAAVSSGEGNFLEAVLLTIRSIESAGSGQISGAKSIMGSGFFNLASIYSFAGRHQEAEIVARKAVALSSRPNYLVLLAEELRALGKRAEAKPLCFQAIEEAEKLKLPNVLASAWRSLAKMYRDEKKMPQATEACKKSLRGKIHSTERIQTLIVLADVETEYRRWPEAETYWKEIVSSLDSEPSPKNFEIAERWAGCYKNAARVSTELHQPAEAKRRLEKATAIERLNLKPVTQDLPSLAGLF